MDISDSRRIARIILAKLSRELLPLPLYEEREPTFTARVLMPRVDLVLKEIDIAGVTLHGDGRSPAPSTVIPSCEFKPDIALLYERRRIAAFEVKFLRDSGRQAALASAIGQAAV